MGNWIDLFKNLLDEKGLGAPEITQLRQRYAWVEEIHQQAEKLISPEALKAAPPEEIYSRLKRLGIPQCPLRIAHLGRVNEAEKIVESLIKLLETQGGLEEKYRAAKFPQAGVVTITELLCVSRPARFICRNTVFTRALAKVVPLYTKKALEELPYREFTDICRVLCEIMEKWQGESGKWAAMRRYLLLYAILTEK